MNTLERDEGESLYVQGMNVLAAPFLYVLPTEVCKLIFYN